MSLQPSRAQVIVAPLPFNGVLSASVAPAAPAIDGDVVESTAMQAAAAGTETQAAKNEAPVAKAADDGSRADGRGTAAHVAASDEAKATTHAKAAPAMPVFGKPATTTAHVGKPETAPQPSPSNAGSIGGALFALVMVIGLILALGWIAKRMPGFRGASGNAALRVVGSLTLGPRERVVVVAVGNTQLLLGVGAGGTRTLHTLTEPLPVPDQGNSPAFAQLLAQHFGKKA